MRDIFKAEGLRYRLWILLYAAVHLLLLAFATRLADLGQQPLNIYRVVGAGYALTGILLGLHQMGTWRRPNQWLNLLHRPLAAKRIAMGLLAAGVSALVVGVVLPILAALAWQAWGTARVVDLRHLWLPVAALLVASCGYLAGAYGALADRRYSSCGLVFLFWIAASQASGAALLVVQVLAVAWLLAMVLVVFRPDPGAAPRSAVATVLLAVPVQVGAYLLLMLLGFVGQLIWIMQGTHPINMSTPPRGGFVETDRMSGRDRLLAGLADSTLAEAPLWREQVALSEVHTIGRQLGVATSGEMSNSVPMGFEDAEARIGWTFSHDRMRYEGVGVADGLRVGELGVGSDGAAFDAIATADGELPGMARGDAALIAGNTLYQYISATRRIVPRLDVTQGEYLLGTTAVGGSLVAISDRALYVFDGRHLLDNATPVSPRQRMAIPGASGDLSRAEMIELVDGYLVSFNFSRRAYDLFGGAPYQSVLWVDDAGKVTPVATRMLGADFPTVYRYRTWWASPVMFTLCEAATDLFAGDDPYRSYATPPVPTSMRMLAAGLLAISFCLGAWLAWRRELSWPARIAWVLVCAVVGIPALVGLALIVPRAERFPMAVPITANA